MYGDKTGDINMGNDTSVVRLKIYGRQNIEVKAGDIKPDSCDNAKYMSLFEKVDSDKDGQISAKDIELFKRNIKQQRECNKFLAIEKAKNKDMKDFGKNLAGILVVGTAALLGGIFGYRCANTMKGMFKMGKTAEKIFVNAGRGLYTPMFAGMAALISMPVGIGAGLLGGKVAEGVSSKSEEDIKHDFFNHYADSIDYKDDSDIFTVDENDIDMTTKLA